MATALTELSEKTTNGATKQVLASKLREVFVTRGYDGATLTHLATAAGLSKASLYHHFPGGKPEMAAALVRHAIADLQRLAFSQLTPGPSGVISLTHFIDGFTAYTHNGDSDCLLAIFNHHRTASEETAVLQALIRKQFDDWQGTLANVYEGAGMRPKKARRAADDLLASLYGALLMARMRQRPELLARAAKRLKKNLATQLDADDD